jgi:hypothetical protein
MLTAIVVGALVASAWGEVRAAKKEAAEFLSDTDRFVDFGVELRVVQKDPNGRELVAGKPLLRVVNKYRFGGMVDVKAAPAQYVGPSRDPQIWYCSEDQAPLILHGDDLPLGLLVYGSEGAGKTVCLAMWHFLRVLEHIGEGREGGQTAPTEPRLEMVRAEMRRLYRREWYRYKASEDLFIFADGDEDRATKIRLVSTHKQSEAQGSRVQGFSWSWAGRDEAQDQVEAHEDIESRGRAARDGRYKQLATATAKDNPQWRTFRDKLLTSVVANDNLWQKFTLLGRRSPFVPDTFWDAKRGSMSLREYMRRVEAQDVPPELVLYGAWERGDLEKPGNLRRIPPGAIDVTAEVMSRWGSNITLLAGHDPGTLFDVTILLKAYRLKGIPAPVWWVVGEVTTEKTTTEQHVKALLEVARRDWQVNGLDFKGRPMEDGATMLVRADPYSDSGTGDKSPDRSVYTVFRQHGIRIMPAAHIASVDKTKVGRVPKEGRIDMVQTLLCAADGTRRLYVNCDDRREPVAPKLVEAFETCERDAAGKAETQRKDKRDMSHWPAALGYGLWEIERPRVEKRNAA